jgi:hypothetical protein
MNNFAAHDNNRLVGDKRMKKNKRSVMNPGVGKMPMSSKHTAAPFKKVRGTPEMGGPGPNKMMMRKKGINAQTDAAGKSQMRKHGMRGC